MIDHPIAQALLAICFTWLMTAVGAAGVFFVRTPNRRLMDGMLGFAAGVMLAATFFSLLKPAIDQVKAAHGIAWLPATIGVLAGGAFLYGLDRLMPHLHLGAPQPEGPQTTWRRSVLLVLAITLHNIPEGLAVGVAFGAAWGHGPEALAGAIALTVGIGLQDVPEGLAVALPLRREGLTRWRAFWFGQLSGAVEPLAAIPGALAVLYFQPLLPYALSFAAGAMLYVIIEELIPESHRGGNEDVATLGAIVGFVTMMILDVALS